MAWAKAGSTTLSSAGDDITVSSLSSSKCIFRLTHTISSGNIQHNDRFGYTSTDTGSNYALRFSDNGTTDATGTSQTHIYENITQASDYFTVAYIVNIATEEKLMISFYAEQTSTGAGTAPGRNEVVGKWTNTSNQFDIINVYNGNTGDFDTGSNVSVLGSELTPASATTIETGSIYIDTDTNQRYFWDGSSWSLQA